MSLRNPSLPPCLRLLLALVVGLAARPEEAAAQLVDAPRAAASAEIAGRLTSVRSDGTWMVGGRLLLRGAGPVAFGLEGWTLTDQVAVGASDPGGGIRLTLSYAGVSTAWRVRSGDGWHAGIGLLTGAGNSTIRLPVTRTEVAADNFLVLEPSVRGSLRLVGPLRLRLEVAHRWVAGVEDLSGIARDDLQGASLSLGLSLTPF